MATPPVLTPQGTVRIPIATLTQLLAQGRRILGVAVTSTTHEVVSVGPPSYQLAAVLSSGTTLTPEELKMLVDQQQAGALVLGGSGLFRADGATHFGVRKLISAVMGVQYHAGQPLPTPLGPSGAGPAAAPFTPWVVQQQQQWSRQQQQHQHQQQQQQHLPQGPPQPPPSYRGPPPHHHHAPLIGGSTAQQQGPRWGGQPLGWAAAQEQHYQQQQQQQQQYYQQQQQLVVPPILLCRENEDDASVMLTRYFKRHATVAFPSSERWTTSAF